MDANSKISGKDVFIRLAGDPEIIKRAVEKSRQHFADESQASTHLVWYLLWLAGLDTQLVPIPQLFAERLFQFGFQAGPGTIEPQAGDIFIDGHDRIGIVAKKFVGRSDLFMATDLGVGDNFRPYRRSTEGIVRYFRYTQGCAPCQAKMAAVQPQARSGG
jgi:hypothetical protein